MSLFRVSLCAAMAIGAMTASAYAIEGACTCTTPLVRGTAPGQFTSVNGDVEVATRRNVIKAQVGSPVTVGTRVLVGAASAASLVLNRCRLEIPENSDVEISAFRGNICLKIVANAPGPVPNPVGVTGLQNPALGIIGLGAAGAIVGGIIGSNGSSPAISQ